MTDKERLAGLSTTRCFSCGQPYNKFVRTTSRGELTRTEILVCRNSNCNNFVEMEGVKNWIKKNSRHYNRDFFRQNNLYFDQWQKSRPIEFQKKLKSY